ncbi:hypothetical protein OS493_008741 [Desmophyllum pertusum]|uniref:SUEL-type lectin domain-containing protein n=1 Tax=Desmophyllum pertusum TaxID=174260 RepID=A0A9X0D5M8_9CNID|nr:hypothetical protein OS493_008741 [Desmophyllum pertusum]
MRSYGLTQHWVCEYGRDTNCHAGISMRVVKHECQGQPKCTLRAINSVFGDPCRGAYKYLEVKYECVPTSCTGLLLRVCEGNSHAIHCHGSKKINILSANYGRLTGGYICTGSIRTTNCGAARSLTKVRNVCQGKRYCYLRANNGKFGDPCYGTKKYLEVRYKCE